MPPRPNPQISQLIGRVEVPHNIPPLLPQLKHGSGIGLGESRRHGGETTEDSAILRGDHIALNPREGLHALEGFLHFRLRRREGRRGELSRK